MEFGRHFGLKFDFDYTMTD